MLTSHVENSPCEHENSNKNNPKSFVIQTLSQPISLASLQRSYSLFTHLNLSNSNIGMCDSLSVLERLKVIDLSYNQIKELPNVCKSMRTICYLDVSHNHLSTFPEWILQLRNALTIKLDNNPIKSSFLSFMLKADWKKVQECCLENLNLGLIPECITNAKYLEYFTFGSLARDEGCEGNSLWMIPEKLPSSITTLDLSKINLSSLDHDWQVHQKLTKFSAKGNDFPWIPDTFLRLCNLEECNLGSCGLFLLPTQMGSLRSLQVLNLSSNKLTSIPQSLEFLTHLKQLDLYGNNIENIQCDLQLLKHLEGCDLWMNYVDPNDCHPHHEKLCRHLRETCAITDRLSVQEDNSQEEETHCWNHEGSFSDQDETDSGRDDAEPSAEASELEQDVRKSGLSCEESWDEQFECEESSESFDLCQVKKELESFLPAAQHAATHVSAPNAFPIVPGQFDDD